LVLSALKLKKGVFNKQSSEKTSQTKEQVKKTVGVKDEKKFKDKAEGILKEGSIDGEENFHLERPGGAKLGLRNQVYLELHHNINN
jgi:hypothetical protein